MSICSTISLSHTTIYKYKHVSLRILILFSDASVLLFLRFHAHDRESYFTNYLSNILHALKCAPLIPNPFSSVIDYSIYMYEYMSLIFRISLGAWAVHIRTVLNKP
jgi:hypothetical protein